MSNYLLEMQGVAYTYPMATAAAVKNLSFRLPAGRKTALIGQNGCGKSTLFLLANGLCRPQQGVILLGGMPLTFDRSTLNRWRQRVGLVFQDPEQQLVAPTVESDISYGLCNQNLPTAEIADRVQQTLADFQLTELANQPLHHLSLGQKKRVSIAGVVTLRPDLLLLDEPTAYLDPVQAKNLLLELDNIARSGTTLLIATHDLDFVYQWADWLMVMQQGTVLLEGETLAILEKLQNIPDFDLGMPLLWQIWKMLPAQVQRNNSPPRSIAELSTILPWQSL
jgi:cobalt/nickel transport system ATP-binding protein